MKEMDDNYVGMFFKSYVWAMGCILLYSADSCKASLK